MRRKTHHGTIQIKPKKDSLILKSHGQILVNYLVIQWHQPLIDYHKSTFKLLDVPLSVGPDLDNQGSGTLTIVSYVSSGYKPLVIKKTELCLWFKFLITMAKNLVMLPSPPVVTLLSFFKNDLEMNFSCCGTRFFPFVCATKLKFTV